MSVRRARYQPPLNSQCLCGSGLKFKRCCLGENDIACSLYIDKANDLMKKNDYKNALRYVRRGITNYTILHKTNTEPYIGIKNEGAFKLLELDIKALSELTENLLFCYRGLSDYSSLGGDLERLRRNIFDIRWQRKITYYQILALLGDNWSNDIGKRELKKLMPLHEEDEIEITQLYLHFYSEDLPFKRKVDLLDNLIKEIKTPSQKLQYQVAKAVQYLCIGDDSEAESLIEKAIKTYELSEQNNNLYGCIQHARALSLLGDIKHSAELKAQAIKAFESLINDDSWTDVGIANIYFELGKCLYHIKEFKKSIDMYQKSIDIDDSIIVKVFISQSELELNDKNAINTIKDVEQSLLMLSNAERLDFIFTYAAISIAFKQSEMIDRSFHYLADLSSLEPIFEKHKSTLLIEISSIYNSGKLEQQSSILKRLKSLFHLANRYIILQPNIAGVGININQILSDLEMKSEKKE
ncbi:SEC-C metal-binding domain-containing protein [Aeromonas veronii]